MPPENTDNIPLQPVAQPPPQQQNPHITQPENPQTTQPKANIQTAIKGGKSKVKLILIIIGLIIIGSGIGFFVGASVSDYLGQKGYLANYGLAVVPIFFFFPMIIYAILTPMTIGIKSTIAPIKFIAFICLLIVSLSLLGAIYLFYSTSTRIQSEILAMPSEVNFQIYKPSKNHPFSNLNESFIPINENVEKNCRAVEYTYYGSLDSIKLLEMKANVNCPSTNYLFSQQDYDKALTAANGKTPYTKHEIAELKLIGDESIIIIKFKNGDTLYDTAILAKKGDTLINISFGDCQSGTDCEAKYIEFYKSLKPI